jgi:O-acetylhomoserine (thiol)-lyase
MVPITAGGRGGHDRGGDMSTAGIHAGWAASDCHRSLTPPIYASSAYAQRDHASLRALFERRADGFAYSRSGNPTTAVLEERITALEGGTGAIAVASGQAATTIALCALAAPGGHVVASSRLYGGTTELLDDTLADLGVTTTVVDPWDLDAWEAAFTEDTRAVIVESIANPGAQLLDLDALSEIAHRHDVPVVVDSTLASPALYRPGEHGADVVVHSATKYLCGHGTTIAGLIVDTGRFDPRRCPQRWERLTTPNRRFGVTFADEYARGASGLLAYARAKYVTDLGATLPAASAQQILVGIETLDLRMRKISAEAAAASFCDALDLWRLAVNLGDARSLVCHPASTTHSHLTSAQREACGVGAGTVRLSVGLEELEDLWADLGRGLAAVRAAVPEAAAVPA